MFRLWAKLFKDTHMIKDITIENSDTSISRTKMIFNAIEEISKKWDLSSPIWLDKNIKDFQIHDKVRFTKDNFIDSFEYDYLELHVIEEADE